MAAKGLKGFFKKVRMNRRGQTLVEFMLLSSIVLMVALYIAPRIPVTFNLATPFLGGKIEYRIETGRGYKPGWEKPLRSPGGFTD